RFSKKTFLLVFNKFPLHLQILSKMGNTRANAILERSISPTFEKPKPSDYYPDRDRYIRAKYVERAFAAGADFPLYGQLHPKEHEVHNGFLSLREGRSSWKDCFLILTRDSLC